ncbi:Asp-tRNA(Asn)/Glu-tRNA(Gln) amidotransferase GatCAB subunit A [Enterobacterales bacterium CwR94]|nr:Asp-tRNA(Asn)/Glu-tRNA(Gln) amidotransferase GatCAB subunit A [Enterobacterales bacterium CwR94]
MTLPVFSLTELHRLIAQGELSAREVAQDTLQKIARDNPQLNAWTTVTDDRLLAEADAVDKQRQRGETLPPLAGIPYAVKNLFDVQGHSTLAGASLFAHRPAARADAFAIRQLHHAGATLSGMLNMDAYAYGFTTENSHYGPTRNPHDLTRVAGGSSGGSAAAVAAGIVPFSLGTDTNGSIRVPASLSGIFGLKPSFGRLSRSGSHPFVASLDHIGPFARSSQDLAQVYDILQGVDPADAFQSARATESVTPVLENLPAGLRVGVLGGYFQQWCDEDARDAVARVAKALNAHAEVVWPEAELARNAAFLLTGSEGGNAYLPALQREPEHFEPNSRERLLAGGMMPAAWALQAQRFRRWFHDRVLPDFATFDILLAPATPCCATVIGQQTLLLNQTEMNVKASMGMLTQPISFLGVPVVTVPLRAASGLPIGVQVIAAPYREDRCLQVAHWLEQQGLTVATAAPLEMSHAN